MKTFNRIVCNINAVGYCVIGCVMVILGFYGFAAMCFLTMAISLHQVMKMDLARNQEKYQQPLGVVETLKR